MPAGIPAYAYNASASAIGGVIRRGELTTVIPTVGSVCLSPSGGDASITIDNYYRDGISFSRAESRVSGGHSPSLNGGSRRHLTYAEVYVRDLRIFDRVRIGLMQATITSTREIGSAREIGARGIRPDTELQQDKTEFDVFLLYRGVEIDGQEVAADVDAQLCSARKYDSFADLVLSRMRNGEDLLLTEDDGINTEELEAIRQDRRPFVGGLVKLRGNIAASAHRARLPQFGKAKFGELLVKPDRQRFSLLRLELDSDWSGRIPPGAQFVETRAFAAAADTFSVQSSSDGEGGSLTSGSGGSNGIPTWP